MTTQELDPLDLLTLAEALAQSKDSARVRTACDRAYYAAFLFARERLAFLGKYIQHDNYRDHQEILVAIGKLPDGMGPRETLHRLRVHRNKFTYTVTALTHPTHALSPSDMLSRARLVIDFIQSVR